MIKNYTLVFLLLFVVILTGFSQTKTIPYQQLPTSTGSLTGSNMYFGATMTTSSITITFAGPSDRWIAFGFGTSMSPTDVFIYSCGQTTSLNPLGWDDYYNSSSIASGVNIDAIQNWNVISTATVAGGQRTVTASRALNTGDPNDVALAFTSSSLNLVWARGATADYTIAYHGTTNRASGISLGWLSLPTASFAASSATICQAATVAFSNNSTGGQTSYTWSFPSGNPATSTATNSSVTYTVPGTYSVSLIATNAVGSDTLNQINYITVTPTVATSLSIIQTSGTNPICSGAVAIFSASAINGGAIPSYQWKVNGSNIGINSASLSLATSTSPEIVTCILASNAACASPTQFTSSPITLTVSSTAPASVSVILQSGTNPMCVGAAASFSATPGNGGANPIYQWYINNALAGGNSSAFSTNILANGDLVNCVLMSSAPCASSTLASSNPITMSVTSVISPSVSIGLLSGTNPLCIGDLITASASASGVGNSPLYHWQLNGNDAGNNNATFSTFGLSNSSVLTCTVVSNLSCASPTSAASNAISFTVDPLPAVSFSAINDLCVSSDTIRLTQGSPAGGIYTGTGVIMGTEFSSSLAGTFIITYSYSDTNGCLNTATTSAIVSVCLRLSEEGLEAADVLIFPNPVQGQLTINAGEKKIIAITVKDMSGKTALKRNYQNEKIVSLDLSEKPSGDYILEIVLENKTVYTRVLKKD